MGKDPSRKASDHHASWKTELDDEITHNPFGAHEIECILEDVWEDVRILHREPEA